ncbi:PPE family protein [Mycobacterium sp. Dal123C01]|uniref:PPE family protein n=1 Tax=Mycobacterium sp. Dal123C01 TaxID=3457577 RepID=UPI00403EA49A
MDFGTLPPETNSGLMYSGPGSRSMMNAAIAWDGLADRLYNTAARCSSVISTLAAGWQGPAATALTQAAATHTGWLNTVAAQAQRMATQAKSAANAYELALAAMVHPSAIEANRMLRTWLAETNCLGQSSPVLADAESDYDQMWAQDVDTMYTYAAASADAVTVTPFLSPPPAGAEPGVTQAPGSWALTAAPEVISAGCQVVSTIPDALDALSASPLTPFDVFLSPVTASLSKLSSLSAPSDFAINHLNSLNKRAALNNAVALLSRLPNRSRAGGAASTTGLGCATAVGTLSVPQGWVAKTPRPVTAAPQCGWGYAPVRLVELNETPEWPLTR